ncbi:hypothetical protein [Amycolatopsis silviterrae]|uniref:WXG100 family type VII secretion target n=1 Tax=Amycolatopsis silviterrae TaxID=1656914 RepID=A0ABW5H8K6_9PSEU
MSGGFGAVPEELFRTANSIGDVIGGAAGLLWQGPSGDYGHPGVQAGWAGFIEEVRAEVARLTENADGHGDDLRTAAGKYSQSDAAATGAIGKFGAGLGDLFGEAAGGGVTPFAGVEGQAEAKIGSRLDGAPGGGFTGGLTPSQLNERLGEPEGGLHDVPGGGWAGGATGRISGSIDDDGPVQIMSPERSRQLFPGASGDPAGHDGDGPVF